MEETPGLAAARLAIHDSREGCFTIVFSELFSGLTPYNSEELAQAMEEDHTLTSLCIIKSISPPVADNDDDEEEEDPLELESFCAFLRDYISQRSHLRKVESKRRSPMTSDVNFLAMIEIAAALNASIDELAVVDADLFDEDVTWNPNGYQVMTLENIDLVGKRFPDMGVHPHSLCTIPVDRLEMNDIRPQNASSAEEFAVRAMYLKPKVFVVDQEMLDFVSPDFTDLEALTILPSSTGLPFPQRAVQRVLESLMTNTTLTELHVHPDSTFDKDGLDVLNGYVARNRALYSFFKNPEDFTPAMVLSLFEKLDHFTSEKFRMVRTLVSLGYF